jgi:cytochrome b ascorbate-dependent protein 3
MIRVDNVSNMFVISSVTQKIAGACSIVLAFTAARMVYLWGRSTDTTNKYLGGFEGNVVIFNWHPVLMVSGLILCSICSLLSYRVIPLPKWCTKLVHVGLHTVAISCTIGGLYAVFTSHNYPEYNSGGKYIANLYSIHSILGISAIAVYLLNYALGFYFFLTSLASVAAKKVFVPTHVFVGIISIFISAFAVFTGIQEKSTFLGCTYVVTSADVNPASNYHNLPEGCRLANSIGIVVLVSVILCAYALFGRGGAGTGAGEIQHSQEWEESRGLLGSNGVSSSISGGGGGGGGGMSFGQRPPASSSSAIHGSNGGTGSMLSGSIELGRVY